MPGVAVRASSRPVGGGGLVDATGCRTARHHGLGGEPVRPHCRQTPAFPPSSSTTELPTPKLTPKMDGGDAVGGFPLRPSWLRTCAGMSLNSTDVCMVSSLAPHVRGHVILEIPKIGTNGLGSARARACLSENPVCPCARNVPHGFLN